LSDVRFQFATSRLVPAFTLSSIHFAFYELHTYLVYFHCFGPLPFLGF